MTYHAKLLETNPVEALRQQAEERGHWSAKWIPPFPPDDEEAQEFARNNYLQLYYESIGDIDNPIYTKALRDISSQMKIYTYERDDVRSYDLMKLTWTSLDEGTVVPYGLPSDYFKDPFQEQLLKQLQDEFGIQIKEGDF